jgi:hypothetical protein
VNVEKYNARTRKFQKSFGEVVTKNMRSGPATQTAFADVKFTSAIARVLPPAGTCVVTNARYLMDHELRWRICTKGAVASGSRLAGLAVPPCETVSEEAATPGLPATLARFGKPLDSSPSRTAAEPALRDHWQRDVHACSDCNVSHREYLSNRKPNTGCAKTVDARTCLWKGKEKTEII